MIEECCLECGLGLPYGPSYHKHVLPGDNEVALVCNIFQALTNLRHALNSNESEVTNWLWG